MRTVHANMNINDIEFMAVVDDAMNALDKNGIGQREKEEILFILYSLRPEVVHL
jgi:hemoglobin